HNNHHALAEALQAHARVRRKIVVCDGVYPEGGQKASLYAITQVAHAFGADVYVDDAHGIGVLGAKPSEQKPYGYGGGGAPVHLGVSTDNVIHVGSFSKAFGVPIAFVAGPSRFIETLRKTAAAHIHSSPPAIPVIAAALSALRVNAAWGEKVRE